MTLTSLTMLLGALMAQGGDVPAPAKVNMIAVQALNEGRQKQYFGPGLEPVRSSLESLDYDSFHRIRSVQQSIPYGEETRITINDRYTLCLQPVSKDAHGRIRVKARIEMAPRRQGDPPINALADTTLVMMPGKKLNLGGLKLREGDLIVVIWFNH